MEKINEPIAIIEKNPIERIECRIENFRNKAYLHLRTYYLDEKDNTWKPTKKGISIPVEQFDDLKAMLEKAEKALNK